MTQHKIHLSQVHHTPRYVQRNDNSLKLFCLPRLLPFADLKFLLECVTAHDHPLLTNHSAFLIRYRLQRLRNYTPWY